jgi:hypothetical protein
MYTAWHLTQRRMRLSPISRHARSLTSVRSGQLSPIIKTTSKYHCAFVGFNIALIDYCTGYELHYSSLMFCTVWRGIALTSIKYSATFISAERHGIALVTRHRTHRSLSQAVAPTKYIVWLNSKCHFVKLVPFTTGPNSYCVLSCITFLLKFAVQAA